MQEKSSQKPPEPMTWGKAAPYLVGAFIFDALRCMFVMFWFLGPALVGAYCAAKVGDVAAVGGLLATGCAAGAVALGIASAAAITAFGTVMAMAVGLLGWLTIGGLLVIRNPKIFTASSGNGLWFAAGLFVSEVPFLGALPAMTTSVAKLFKTQIKKERADMEKYEKEHAAELKQKREQQMAQVAQAQNARMAQIQQQEMAEQEAANDELFEQEQAANDESFTHEEIPEKVRRVA